MSKYARNILVWCSKELFAVLKIIEGVCFVPAQPPCLIPTGVRSEWKQNKYVADKCSGGKVALESGVDEEGCLGDTQNASPGTFPKIALLF